LRVPTLSFFYGIKIVMYWREHPPPHFHAKSAGETVVINILTLEVDRGALAPAKLALVLQWAKMHQSELLEAWELCTQQKSPQNITPLS
jgi:hypothetical protein